MGHPVGCQSGTHIPLPHLCQVVVSTFISVSPYPPSAHHLFVALEQGWWGVEPKPRSHPWTTLSRSCKSTPRVLPGVGIGKYITLGEVGALPSLLQNESLLPIPTSLLVSLPETGRGRKVSHVYESTLVQAREALCHGELMQWAPPLSWEAVVRRAGSAGWHLESRGHRVQEQHFPAGTGRC